MNHDSWPRMLIAHCCAPGHSPERWAKTKFRKLAGIPCLNMQLHAHDRRCSLLRSRALSRETEKGRIPKTGRILCLSMLMAANAHCCAPASRAPAARDCDSCKNSLPSKTPNSRKTKSRDYKNLGFSEKVASRTMNTSNACPRFPDGRPKYSNPCCNCSRTSKCCKGLSA